MMKSTTFLLNDEFKGFLKPEELRKNTKKYLTLMKKHTFSISSDCSLFELINEVKRTPSNVGPYHEISLFEALNRIASDLVLLKGASMLFNDSQYGDIGAKAIRLRMGTTHGFDFEVKTRTGLIMGEAFNAAPSFCRIKHRQAVKKLKEDGTSQAGIIFSNVEVKSILESTKTSRFDKNIRTIYCDIRELI